MSYIYLKGVCSMNFLKKSLSTILCCALTVNTLGLSSIIANATESDSKDYVYDGYKINYDVTNSWGNTEIVIELQKLNCLLKYSMRAYTLIEYIYLILYLEY